ncbi:MAG: rhomboid family intramembrane serine protease [Oceanicaulis sp.]|nr:rhomboid family intramembrane serine protease [Oceanicaulis sp.]
MTGPDPDNRPPPPLQAPRQPMFTGLPPVIAVLLAVMFGAHALEWWSVNQGDGGFHRWLVDTAAVRTGETAARFGSGPLGGFAPYVAHVFLHFGWVHLALNAGALLAFGAAAARPFGTGVAGSAGFLAFFFACAIAGAGLHVLVHMNEASLMAGSSTAVMGLLAAAGWAQGGRQGMLRLAVPLLGLHVVMILADPWLNLPIAWTGHVGGLLVGMIAYPAFVRLFGRR